MRSGKAFWGSLKDHDLFSNEPSKSTPTTLESSKIM